jgi:DNA polymerase V
MTNAAILQGDILIVDRALKPNNNSIVVACLNGEFTVKRMRMKGKSVTLVPENAEFKPIPITDQMEFEIWGVVTYVIHNLCQSR